MSRLMVKVPWWMVWCGVTVDRDGFHSILFYFYLGLDKLPWLWFYPLPAVIYSSIVLCRGLPYTVRYSRGRSGLVGRGRVTTLRLVPGKECCGGNSLRIKEF